MGQCLEAGNVYEVKPNTAMTLIQTGKARLAETSLIKVRILRDDILHGLRRGEAVEMPASGAEKLIKENKAEFCCENFEDEGILKVEVLIIQDTSCRGRHCEQGKTYYLKPSEAAILISMRKAKSPDLAVAAEVKFNSTTVFKGGHYKVNDTVKLPVTDAEELIRRNVAEPISIEESQEAQEAGEEKKSFFEKVLGR